MESNWAAGHLQVIRTLMERSAIYRRALAPIMLFLGILGIIAAVIGRAMDFRLGPKFGWFWMGVGVLGVSGAYVMVRRQALRESDVFWSPPTRRVTQAFLPPLFAGMILGIVFTTVSPAMPARVLWLPSIWMILYGCAVHAAGFFMPRGMKLFGWGFVALGSVFATFQALERAQPTLDPHVLMGVSFGGLHLAYGVYLYFTEQRKNGS